MSWYNCVLFNILASYGTKYSRVEYVNFVEASLSKIWRDIICWSRPYPFKFFKGWLPQKLLSLLLNALSHVCFLDLQLLPREFFCCFQPVQDWSLCSVFFRCKFVLAWKIHRHEDHLSPNACEFIVFYESSQLYFPLFLHQW